MQQSLREKTAEAIKELYGQEISVEKVLVNIPPKEFPFDFTVVAFPFSKLVKKSPDHVAAEIGSSLKNKLEEIDTYEAIKGFINIRLKDDYWIQYLHGGANDPNFGQLATTGKRVMIEYCGPNTNKPLHLGHLRNIFIGYSMSNILKAAGNEVVKVNIYNDRGVHICKSMLAYQKFGHGETPESSGIKGDHLVGDYYVRFDKELKVESSEYEMGGISEDAEKKRAPLSIEVQEMLKKWEEGDPEVRALWQAMNSWAYQGFEETYRRLGVDFDKAYYESETYQLGKSFVMEGLERGIFFRKEDGSVWVDLTGDGLDEKLLIRADGTSVYITQDLGTADLRYKDYHPDAMIYTVANEQDYHFKVLKLISKKLGLPYADGMYHLSYGLVDLPSGRMKSREGTIVDADDLIDEMERVAEKLSREQGKIEGMSEEESRQLFKTLGLGALKFFILKVDPKKKMLFNPEESIDFHGFTGPFIQYTHARIRSLLRKTAERQIAITDHAVPSSLHPKERQLIIQLFHYPSAISEAASKYEPSTLANYLYILAKDYNQFWADLPILTAEDDATRAFRLKLSSTVASVIKKGMELLGIQAPERM